MQREEDGCVDRNRERADDDVVARRRRHCRDRARNNCRCRHRFYRDESPNLAVGAGVAEIEGELLGLHVHVQGIRIGLGEINGGPNLRADERESENLDSDEDDGDATTGLARRDIF